MTAAVQWDMPAPGEWTTDDLDALPDDGRRRELIDGVVTVSPSPTAGHQRLAMLLGAALDAGCPPDLSVTQAVDIRIAHDRSLSPDVLVATATATSRDPSFYLPRDARLVIEIVSRGSRVMDRITKPALYAQAGIPCFWRIETEDRLRVVTFRLDDGADVYTPTGEFADELEVDEPFPISLDIARLAGRR